MTVLPKEDESPEAYATGLFCAYKITYRRES